MKCDDCKLAEWRRTATGRLHPDKSGRCTWEYSVRLPPAFCWPGMKDARPSGGYIERGRDIPRCIYKQGGVNPSKWLREAGDVA